MIIYINDRPCEAQVGDLLLSTAKHNKAHIGYICGGNGICQSCFVYVREGAECLSPPSDEEKAFISDKLFQDGGRLACQTVLVKEGTVRVITRAETLRRLVLGLNVPGFITYAQTIGYNVVNKLPSGAANVFTRVRAGKLNPIDTLGKIASGLGPASLLAANNFVETFSFMQGPVNLVGGTAKGVLDAASGVVCSITGGRLHLPGSTCTTAVAPTEKVERVKITMKP
ncbi:MAG: (2Fe-2S)-binding protein [Chlorobiaceae bacterium]|nr:(2Fe-2S)-binding protein [Chlorobiaceae bacterium]NTW75006.1 (2Fe-2S)-binding protein [Chlorobiaceae bacterium]